MHCAYHAEDKKSPTSAPKNLESQSKLEWLGVILIVTFWVTFPADVQQRGMGVCLVAHMQQVLHLPGCMLIAWQRIDEGLSFCTLVRLSSEGCGGTLS